MEPVYPGRRVRIPHVVDVDAYLERIGLAEPTELNLESLELLQRAHLTAIPFENLDVYARREVRTTEKWVVSKVVQRRRGGWCFDLNGAFAGLLEGLGYQVRRLAAHVLSGSGAPMPTHLTLEVTLDRPYLVDVGFGDSFIKPLPLDSEGPHDGGTGKYEFVFAGEEVTLVSHENDGSRQGHYRFGGDARTLADFEEASRYLRTTPGLQWTETRFATRLLEGGPDRVTLLADRIKFRRDGVWSEHPVDESEWDRLLADWFALSP
jgi:N-hydroxyarylamine O-acetyltransferase